ncbi:MAG: pyridoxamine 5'-phosphate oxidase [Gemmatimonadetes bacterium]|nr:pyridoxamine 5'-phosphate oxidase [Gemmatimonadota bacterium]
MRVGRADRVALALQRLDVRLEPVGLGARQRGHQRRAGWRPVSVRSTFRATRAVSFLNARGAWALATRKASRGKADRGLREQDVDPDPIQQFARWFAEALAAKLIEPTAMALATATRAGVPSARMVLLKGFDQRGFVFYTNYESGKGRELAENPHAALVFWWDRLYRQVCITGTVARVSEKESDEYFASRPLGSRIGALASRQSSVLVSRDELDRRVAELSARYQNGTVPRPPSWGGFRLEPYRIEFWQGRDNRLHDRLRYTRQEGGRWKIERLSP